MKRSASALLVVCLFAGSTVLAADKPRARDLGVPFDGTPGPGNAITDVRGVTVGHSTMSASRPSGASSSSSGGRSSSIGKESTSVGPSSPMYLT